MPKGGSRKPAERAKKREPPSARSKRDQMALAKGLEKAIAAGANVIEVAAGAKVTVSVSVDSGHLVPYAIALDGEVILDSLVSKSVTVSVASGRRHRLTWQFIHGFESEWNHTVSVAVNDGKPQKVDSKSSQNGDQPDTSGMVILSA